MLYPVSELLDRLSIARLKATRIGTRDCKRERASLQRALAACAFPDAAHYLKKLDSANREIWALEASLLRGSLEEIGKRAILIRHANQVRIRIKNEIVAKTGEGFRDHKRDHVSAL
jgi:hypothetical protein